MFKLFIEFNIKLRWVTFNYMAKINQISKNEWNKGRVCGRYEVIHLELLLNSERYQLVLISESSVWASLINSSCYQIALINIKFICVKMTLMTLKKYEKIIEPQFYLEEGTFGFLNMLYIFWVALINFKYLTVKFREKVRNMP